jgi:hypothetical protein
MFLFQEAIVRSFGFIPFQPYQTHSSATTHPGNLSPMADSFGGYAPGMWPDGSGPMPQFVHVSGIAFLMIRPTPANKNRAKKSDKASEVI